MLSKSQNTYEQKHFKTAIKVEIFSKFLNKHHHSLLVKKLLLEELF